MPRSSSNPKATSRRQRGEENGEVISSSGLGLPRTCACRAV